MKLLVTTEKMNPQIIVYSREGCDICSRIKERIKDLGFEYEEKNVDEHISFREDWREAECDVVLAGYMLNDEHLPIISINGEFTTIAKALSALKEIKNGSAQ